MFEQNSIRVLEASDDAEALNFQDSDLPILHQDGGWTLSYLDADGRRVDHLVTGAIGDVGLAVGMARAYLDRSPLTTAWPHSGAVVPGDRP
jgi:hypothetical protein